MTHETRTAPDTISSLHQETINAVQDQLRLDAAGNYLTWLRSYKPSPGESNVPAYEDEVARMAHDISTTVRRSLRFHYDSDHPSQITSEAIGETRTTTCYGFTILASEALEAADIEHWIAYANNHGFILVPQYEKGTTLFINPSDPRLDGEISQHQAHFQPQVIRDGLEQHPRKSAWFSSELYAKFSKGVTFVHLLGSASNDWLTLENKKALTAAKCYSDRGNTYFKREKEQGLRQLVTSIYEPRDGRRILQQYGQFQHFVTKGDTTEALAYFRALQDQYPEIDIRNDQHFFTKLIAQLAEQGVSEEAHEAIDQLYANLSQTNNPLADMIRADYVRFLGHTSADRQSLERAMDLYKQAENERNAAIVQGKTRRVAAIIKGLGLAQRSDTDILTPANT